MTTSTPAAGSGGARASTASFGTFLEQVRAEPIYVILGVQGSGTNLLRSILSGAFNFSVVQDQALVYNAAMKLGPRPSTEEVRRQFEGLRSRMRPSTMSRRSPRRIKTNGSFEGVEQHFDPTRITSGPELARFLYAYSAFRRGTTLMAIKSDDLWETIGDIDTVLPSRRIILLTRDFRDNLLSVAKKDFGPIEPLVAARYVKERFAHYHAEYHRTNPAQRLHVRYEELLEAPDAFVARFQHHFGVGVQGHAPPPVDTARIRRHNVKKWASLTAQELAYCEAILRDELNAYGYGTECEPVNEPAAHIWLMAKGRDVARRVPQKLRVVTNRFLK